MDMVAMTKHEYNAVVWAASRIEYELDNNLIPDSNRKVAMFAVQWLDKVIEDANKIMEEIITEEE